ncbi:MAG: acetylxylan esterase [Candidatus Omnitrophica bacterium]|nr:acetylxylan esterase [Candidatus Omnitrophota bacterium]
MIVTQIFTLPALLYLSSCAYYKPAYMRPPVTLPDETIAYYAYPLKSQAPQIRQIEVRENYTVKQVEFPISLPQEMLEKSWDEIRDEWDKFTDGEKMKGRDLKYKVRVDFYEAHSPEKLPLIILSPILGGSNDVAEIFAAFFARNGFHAAILHREKLMVDRTQDLDQMEKYLRRAVMRARQGVDWLLEQPSVDGNRVGTFGISFGGIINTFLAALDKRLKYHVIAMAGGNLAHVIVECPEKSIRPHIEWYMKEYGLTKDELQSALHKQLRTDTLAFAKAIDPANVLMFIGIFDHVIKRELSRNLWKAMGTPEAVFFPFGHYSSAVVMPYIGYKSLKFFRHHFYGDEPIGNGGNFTAGLYVPNQTVF